MAYGITSVLDDDEYLRMEPFGQSVMVVANCSDSCEACSPAHARAGLADLSRLGHLRLPTVFILAIHLTPRSQDPPPPELRGVRPWKLEGAITGPPGQVLPRNQLPFQSYLTYHTPLHLTSPHGIPGVRKLESSL